MHWDIRTDRSTETDRDRQTILFIDIAEQFTVKAHPALFEGEGRGKKVRNTFIPVYIHIHIQNQTLKSNI